MSVLSLENKVEIDEEWIALIEEAIELGITIEEIREFITKSP